MAGHKRTVLALAVTALLSGCGGTTLNNPSAPPRPPMPRSPRSPRGSSSCSAGAQRFRENGTRGTEAELSAGEHSRRRVHLCGGACRASLRRQLTCAFRRPSPGPRAIARRNGNGQIIARIGIQGRVIAGPAGAPATVEIPLRVAVVQGGVQERTIATKAYRTTVAMRRTAAPFSLVAEDMVYPCRRRERAITSSSISASIRRRWRRSRNQERRGENRINSLVSRF